ncbi:MAG TPA: nuclear transport factor 2 family protein [Dongiaceae bacterium]|nr:nuclear transport factor 2 family protein [Dongiaceae bacterium]
MVRVSLVVIAAFCAGLSLGVYHSGTSPASPEDTRAADLAAIEKLHKADVDATLTQDPSLLNNLWSEDAVKLDVPGAPVVGRQALSEMYAKFRTNYPDFRVEKYAPAISEVQIVDGWAIEVGTFAASFKMSSKDSPVNVNDKGVRVLKRQSDGSWKFAVVGLK